MAILAEIYTSPDDQKAVEFDANPDAFADRRQYREFTALELSTLWAIMQGTEWDAGLMEEFPELLGLDDGERFVHRLPKGGNRRTASPAKRCSADHRGLNSVVSGSVGER